MPRRGRRARASLGRGSSRRTLSTAVRGCDDRAVTEPLEGIAGADAILGRPFPLPAAPLPLARWVDVAPVGEGAEVAWSLDDSRAGSPGRLALYAGRAPAPPRDALARREPSASCTSASCPGACASTRCTEAQPSLRPVRELSWETRRPGAAPDRAGAWAIEELLALAASVASDASRDGARGRVRAAPPPSTRRPMPDSKPDRNLALELVRVTEAAALRPPAWSAAATRSPPTRPPSTRCATCSSTVAMDGIVVIGEGEKDEAPMLYNGEHVGDGSPPAGRHRRRPARGHDARPPRACRARSR